MPGVANISDIQLLSDLDVISIISIMYEALIFYKQYLSLYMQSRFDKQILSLWGLYDVAAIFGSLPQIQSHIARNVQNCWHR